MVGEPESPDLLETLYDYQGRAIRLTRRQSEHLTGRRSYMASMREEIRGTLEDPDEVRRSRDDPASVEVYYRRYFNTPAGEKLVCVVVKLLENDAFILTVYRTDSMKPGELLWRKGL